MKTKDWVNLILLGLVWGTNFMWIKIAVQETGPITLVAYRVLFAIVSLTVVYLIRRPKMPGLKYAGVFIILGLLNVNLPFIVISWSQKYIPSGMAAILNGFVPLFTALLAHFFIADDKFTMAKVVGLAVSFVGVVILMAEEHTGGGINYYLLGQIGMLLACLLFAAGNVYARLKTQGMTADAQAYYQQIMALVVILPMASVFEAPFAIPHLPMTWVALAFLGALNTTAGTLLYFALINSVGASRTSLVTYLFPIVAVVLGFLFLGENPNWRFFVGGGLIFLGIVLFNSRFRLLERISTAKESEF